MKIIALYYDNFKIKEIEINLFFFIKNFYISKRRIIKKSSNFRDKNFTEIC